MTYLRRIARWGGAHSQASGLSLVVVITAAAILWFFAFFVPGQRQAAIGAWRRDLSFIADTRRDFLNLRIRDDLADASFVATFPPIRALVSSAPHEGSGESIVPDTNAILSEFRKIYGDRSVSIRNAEGAAVASSDGPAPEADAVSLAREAARSGKSRVEIVRGPDGLVTFAVAVPIRYEEAGAGVAGAVLVENDASKIFDLLVRPVRSAHSSEALVVRKDGDQILYLSPLLFRKDSPLTFRLPFETPGLAASVALAGEDSFSAYVDYRNVRILAAARRITGAPWGLVIKVDEDEALAPFRRDVLRNGLTWGGLLLALIAAAFGVWRIASHEVTLAHSEARFGALVEQATDAILLVGSDGRILQANGAAEKIYGRTRDELLSLNVIDLRAGATRDALRHDMETASAQGGLLIETRHRRADGSEFPIEVNIGLVKAGDETLFLSIARDITERRAAAEELAKTQQQLRQSQKMEAVGRLAGGVAHDFNNLLTVIQGYADLLRNDSGVGEREERTEAIEQIRIASQRAAGLTRQLLAFSRQQVLQPKVLDLNSVVSNLAPMLRRMIGEDVELVTDLDPRGRRVLADAGQLEQVIMNLVVNARDAMPQGGTVTVETGDVDAAEIPDVEPETPPGRYARLTVRDTGAGMSQQVQAKIFEPFFTTKEHGKGTGLGLATVYGIVKQSGGFLHLNSELGQGATFNVYLPCTEEEPRRVEPASGIRRAVPTEKIILLIEDEEAVRKLLFSVLGGQGYTVLEASSGQEALTVAAGHSGPIHLVLSDVVMPGGGGPKFVSELKRTRPAAQVIFMSGYTDDSVVRHGLTDVGTHFLQKPFTPVTLLKKVREVLEG